MNPQTFQLTFFDQAPMNHINRCYEGRCPSGETVCCLECGDVTCSERCDDIECHVEVIRRKLYKEE